MQTVKFSAFMSILVCVLALTGCGPEKNDLKIQNDLQRNRIAELESELQTLKLKAEKLERQLDGTEGRYSIENSALQQKIDALNEDINKKKELITSMQQQLMFGGTTLPIELNTLLEDFAKTDDMITYDPSRGVIKFKSDLLFEVGSDTVAPAAQKAIKSLCEILNNDQAQKFDIIIAGHTDDMRIGKPETRAAHPSNWHLSAHRAISVLNVMAADGVKQERMSVRGFGEFRPIVENLPNKKGNPQNRRVEIYIVPKGQ